MKVRLKVTRPKKPRNYTFQGAVFRVVFKAEDLDVGMGISQVDDKWGRVICMLQSYEMYKDYGTIYT